MKKPLKVLSATGLATVFAASAIVPVAAAELPTEKVTFNDVVLVYEDKPFEMPTRIYLDELGLGTEFAPLNYIKSSEGKYYEVRDYLDYAGMFDEDNVFEELDTDGLAITLAKIGSVEVDEESGEVNYIWDEQPEDRLNETFFYNVA